MARRNTIDIQSIAPPEAPCFPSRRAWLVYVEDNHRTPPRSQGKPVLIAKLDENGKPRLNPAWNFCRDCAYRRAERAALATQGKCQPDWWDRHARAFNVAQDQAPAPAQATPEA